MVFLSGFSSCNGQVFLFLTLVDRHALVLFVGGNCCFDFQIFHFSLKTFFFISSCHKKIVFYLFFKINRGNILHELGNNRKRGGIRKKVFLKMLLKCMICIVFLKKKKKKTVQFLVAIKQKK
jgi:hypothetical protein